MKQSNEEMKEMEKMFDGLPQFDFLDWCIDCSFNEGELSKMTSIQLKKTKKSVEYKRVKDQPFMVITTFKALVEFNLIMKQVKWSVFLALGYGAIKILF